MRNSTDRRVEHIAPEMRFEDRSDVAGGAAVAVPPVMVGAVGVVTMTDLPSQLPVTRIVYEY